MQHHSFFRNLSLYLFDLHYLFFNYHLLAQELSAFRGIYCALCLKYQYDLTAGELHISTFAEILTENALMLLGKTACGPCTVDIHNEQVNESRHIMAYSECWELCNTRNM